MNPYEELGVASDATEAQIRSAYRKKATKTHPDKAGGTADAFSRTAKALAILTNPKARKRFDETGEAREEPVDTKRSQALQIIEQLLTQAMTAYASSGFASQLDPRNKDIIKDMTRQIQESIESAKKEIRSIQNRQTFLRDFRRRFVMSKKGDPADPIGRSLDNQIRLGDAGIDAANTTIEGLMAAIEILEGYKFTREAEAMRSTTWSGISFSTSGTSL